MQPGKNPRHAQVAVRKHRPTVLEFMEPLIDQTVPGTVEEEYMVRLTDGWTVSCACGPALATLQPNTSQVLLTAGDHPATAVPPDPAKPALFQGVAEQRSWRCRSKTILSTGGKPCASLHGSTSR